MVDLYQRVCRRSSARPVLGGYRPIVDAVPVTDQRAVHGVCSLAAGYGCISRWWRPGDFWKQRSDAGRRISCLPGKPPGPHYLLINP